MNFTDKNKTQMIRNIEENILEPLKRNGLILSYEKLEGLHQDPQYVIYLPERKLSKLGGIEGPEKNDWGIGKKRLRVRKAKMDLTDWNHSGSQKHNIY